MSKTKSTSVTWKGPASSPASGVCYDSGDITLMYNQSTANPRKVGYYRGEEPHPKTDVDTDFIYLVSLDSDNKPLFGIDFWVARPCPPFCEGDGSPGGSPTTPIEESNKSTIPTC